jgi:hypothetical protein
MKQREGNANWETTSKRTTQTKLNGTLLLKRIEFNCECCRKEMEPHETQIFCFVIFILSLLFLSFFLVVLFFFSI